MASGCRSQAGPDRVANGDRRSTRPPLLMSRWCPALCQVLDTCRPLPPAPPEGQPGSNRRGSGLEAAARGPRGWGPSVGGSDRLGAPCLVPHHLVTEVSVQQVLGACALCVSAASPTLEHFTKSTSSCLRCHRIGSESWRPRGRCSRNSVPPGVAFPTRHEPGWGARRTHRVTLCGALAGRNPSASEAVSQALTCTENRNRCHMPTSQRHILPNHETERQEHRTAKAKCGFGRKLGL